MPRVLLLILMLLPLPAMAEEVVADLSQTRVAITANFAGSKILLFGAIRREEPIPHDSSLEVIVTVAGPLQPLIVRRKSRVAAIWINTAASEIDQAPSFYAVATSAPFDEVLSNTENLRHHISIERAIRAVDSLPNAEGEAADFVEALIRIRQNEGIYRLEEGAVTLREATLFRTEIALPANLTEGVYTTRIFLTRDGQVIDSYETDIQVGKVGLERWVYGLAHSNPLIYGILSLTIAILAGWGASAIFRSIRG